MLFTVEASSPVSIASQLAIQVRASVASGDLAPGERLPPARDLAQALKVNMHTVLRAYGQLRDEGVIDMRQGRGAFVRADAGPGLIRVTELASQLVHEARKLGMSRPDLIHVIDKAGTL